MDEETPVDFSDLVDAICADDSRYRAGAYYFVREALDYSVNRLPEHRHITGAELLEGVTLLAFERFGPMCRTVLNHWGLHDGKDVGEIVFRLIGAGIMSRTEEDSLEDFSGIVRYDDAFESEYRW